MPYGWYIGCDTLKLPSLGLGDPRLGSFKAEQRDIPTKSIIAPRPRFGYSGASPYQLLAICYFSTSFRILAHVAELADAYGSGPYGATRGGSSPLVSIK
jgi:hypothetical protein